jgi:tetraacyldisaccharide 4'-kinase
MTAKIISVGNIAMGGTGKTPFTIFLAKLFTQAGKKVAILSRGYKGRLGTGLNLISDGSAVFHSPPFAADEPYMMALNLPKTVVITGKDRNKAYNYAMERFAPDIFILDDAFQHRKMRRDVNILLLDHASPLSTGFIFPFGYLREFPSAIKRADMIIFTRSASAEIPEQAAKYCADKPVFFCSYYYSCFNMLQTAVPISALSGKEVWLLSGIARPKQFEQHIATLGLKIAGHSKFPDHYNYTAEDMKKLTASAQRLGAGLLMTTEKDFVRIPDAFKQAFIYPTLAISFLNGTDKDFVTALSSKIRDT